MRYWPLNGHVEGVEAASAHEARKMLEVPEETAMYYRVLSNGEEVWAVDKDGVDTLVGEHERVPGNINRFGRLDNGDCGMLCWSDIDD